MTSDAQWRRLNDVGQKWLDELRVVDAAGLVGRDTARRVRHERYVQRAEPCVPRRPASDIHTEPYLTLPYLRGGQVVTPAQRWGRISVRHTYGTVCQLLRAHWIVWIFLNIWSVLYNVSLLYFGVILTCINFCYFQVMYAILKATVSALLSLMCLPICVFMSFMYRILVNKLWFVNHFGYPSHKFTSTSCVVRCDIISSCHSAVTSKIVKVRNLL